MAAAFALATTSSVAHAQGGRRNDTARPLGRERIGGAGRGARAGQQANGLPALRREIRQRFGEVVKRQLSLTDELSQRLQQTDDKYQRQRQEITRDEREARQGLRMMLEDTTATPDAGKVDQYLSRLVQAQHKRADLLDAEQKELSTFLNPVQRAKYMALREQLNKRITELNQQQGGGRRGAPPPNPAP
jgi:Spy/CpxP family protein refolding chaperone